MADWSNRNVTVLGLGRSGISTAGYLVRKGASVLVSESASSNPEKESQAAELRKLGVKVEMGSHSDEALSFGELIITSPGIPPNSEVMKRARKLGKEVICDVELTSRECSIPIIAVTGTNGKSTTCALISHILTESGRKAPACGNIGIPILDQLDKRPDYLVVEVSSFQSEYCNSLAPQVAVWLNLTPDHLDWHGGLENYTKAKQKLFARQRADQFAVLNFDDPVVASTSCRSQLFPFSVKGELEGEAQSAFMKGEFLAYRLDGRTRVVCAESDLQIRGRHNLENVLAATAVAALVGITPEEIEKHLQSFTALEHRLEYVATVNGVPFYNDSKATNTVSTVVALESFPDEKVVLIAGGRDKGTPLEDFVAAVKQYVSVVILLGEARERFAQGLKAGGFNEVHIVDSLKAAIELGEKLKRGPVILSPACASYDMFRDYEERGRVFKDLVRARVEKLAPSL